MIGVFIFQRNVLATCKHNLNIVSKFPPHLPNRLKFIKYLMSMYYMPGTVVGIRECKALGSSGVNLKKFML